MLTPCARRATFLKSFHAWVTRRQKGTAPDSVQLEPLFGAFGFRPS
ncbi:MAG: hypothetical protein ACLVG9_00170 [Eubacteriales bacterium]